MTRLRLYNPAQLAPEELKASFVARMEALEEMLLLLKEQPPDRPCQHLLLIGPRGMGKTTLGLRFLHAVQELPDLAERWQPVPYYEENYEIGDLAGFWLAALRHLTRATGDPSWERRANALVQEEQNRDRCAAYALAALVDYCKGVDKRLILFVENLDTVFAQLRDEREIHALRADLLTRPEVLVLGSANAVFEAIRSHGQPFYEFFRLVFLESISQKETERLLATLVQLEDRTDVPRALSFERGRLETIRRLTGGNPRLLALACRMLLDSPLGSAFDDLEQLIDEQTPYFKARFEELPPQARKIFHCLADGWTPMLAKEVAGATQLNSSHASAQLRQLLDRRYIREVRLPGEKRTRYEVSDRFYNLYCVLRFSSSNRLRLERLVAFLHDLFGTTGMRSIYPRFLEVLRQDGRRGQETADWLEILAGHVAVDRDFPDREHWRHQALNLAASLIGPSAPVIANIEQAFTVPRRTAPSDQDEWLKLGAEHYNSQRYDDAAQTFRNVLNTQPDNLLARACLGFALNSAERYEEATEAFDRFLENAREEDSQLSTLLTTLVLGSKSVACLQMERHAQGIAALDQLSRHVSSNDPPLIRSIYARVCWLDGHTLAEAGRSLEAIEIWRQGLEFVRPDDLADLRYVAAISLGGMARAFVALEEEEEALAAWEVVAEYVKADDAKELREEAVFASINIASTSFPERINQDLRLESYEGSISAWQSMSKFVRPDDPADLRKPAAELSVIAGGLLNLFRSFERAEIFGKKATEIDPTNHEGWLLRTNTILMQGDTGRLTDAETYARRAVDSAPDDLTADHALAEVLAGLSKWKEALDRLERIANRIGRGEAGTSDLTGLTDSLIDAISAGHGKRVREILETSGLGELMEPLWYAARAELSEEIGPLPAEIMDAVKEIRQRIASAPS